MSTITPRLLLHEAIIRSTGDVTVRTMLANNQIWSIVALLLPIDEVTIVHMFTVEAYCPLVHCAANGINKVSTES